MVVNLIQLQKLAVNPVDDLLGFLEFSLFIDVKRLSDLIEPHAARVIVLNKLFINVENGKFVQISFIHEPF
jgi:hypothetical protein